MRAASSISGDLAYTVAIERSEALVTRTNAPIATALSPRSPTFSTAGTPISCTPTNTRTPGPGFFHARGMGPSDLRLRIRRHLRSAIACRDRHHGYSERIRYSAPKQLAAANYHACKITDPDSVGTGEANGALIQPSRFGQPRKKPADRAIRRVVSGLSASPRMRHESRTCHVRQVQAASTPNTGRCPRPAGMDWR